VWAIAVNSTTIVLSTGGGGQYQLYSTPKSGNGDWTLLARSSASAPLAIDETTAYFAGAAIPLAGPTADVDGGGPNRTSWAAVGLDATSVYWIDAASGTLERRKKSDQNGAPEVLASGLLAVSLGSWGNPTLTVTATDVFAADATHVYRVPLDGSGAKVLRTGTQLAMDGQPVLIGDVVVAVDMGVFYRIPLAGGPATQIAAGSVESFVATSRGVAWSDFSRINLVQP